MVASSAYIVGHTPAKNRSTVFGIYFAIMQSNSLLSPVVGSFIDRWDYASTFIIGAIATVAFTIICMLFLRSNDHRVESTKLT